MKKLICYLFHKAKHVKFSFIDVVTGEPVHEFKCEKCNRLFLSTSSLSTCRMDVNEKCDLNSIVVFKTQNK